jgi:hypothetical protein
VGGDKTAKGLVLIDVSVAGFDGVPLNEIIEFEFSEAVDPDTVRPDTIQIREGPNYGKQVPGFFRIDGNKVLFYPRLPILPDLSDAGLQPGKPYRITLPGTPKVATVRNYANDRLEKKTVENFQTALAGSPDLFTDNFLDPLPPRVTFMNPADGSEDVPADSRITMTFNRRPLHPATVTSTNIRLTMVKRLGQDVQRAISGSPVISQSHDSVSVEFVSTFPLADDATYELVVDRRVQDLVGNDVIPFTATFGVRDEPFRFSEISLEFTELERTMYMDEDLSTASWNEAVDEALAALFTVAGGNGTAGDLTPTANQNFTPDDFNRGVEVVYEEEDGIEYDVYNFRVIDIPSGVQVRFSQRPGGPNRPAKLLSLKPVRIDGVLTVAGGVGQQGNGGKSDYQSTVARVAKGGTAGPGGGDGGDNYHGTKAWNTAPEVDGDDVLYGGGGGKGGEASSGTYYYSYGGGGGGGGSREDGKAGVKGYNSNNWGGAGGKGGKSAANRGYPANEERKPNVGGAGGAPGGMGGYYSQNWKVSAGSGGGGGGGITVQSAGSVTIGSQGQILANGGTGGSLGGRNYYGGCGGGGAGGSILIRATATLVFELGAKLDVAGGAERSWEAAGDRSPERRPDVLAGVAGGLRPEGRRRTLGGLDGVDQPGRLRPAGDQAEGHGHRVDAVQRLDGDRGPDGGGGRGQPR